MQRGLGYSHEDIVALIKEDASKETGALSTDLHVCVSYWNGEVLATVVHADRKSHIWKKGAA